MNYRRDIRAENVSEWLKIATDGLCESSKGRITLEIEAHYNEAVSEFLAEGKNKPDAEVLALEQLGCVMAAKKSFRKRHLTEREEKIISGSLTDVDPKVMLTAFLWTLPIIAMILFFTKLSALDHVYLTLVCLLGFFLLPAASHGLKKRPRTTSNISKILLVQFAHPVTFVFLPMIAAQDYRIAWVFLPFLILQAVRCYRMWRKIRSVRDTDFTNFGSV